MMKLGIPTIRRYDLLKSLIESVERGSCLPSGYIIVDNGGELSESDVRGWIGTRGASSDILEFIKPQRNLGVAASWNLMIDRAAPDAIIISNDDIVFGEHTLRELSEGLEQYPFVEGDGWALFGQRFELIQTVGYYDETFWPAYYEDVDYDLRLRRVGVIPHRALSEPVHHVGWATLRTGDADWVTEGRERNHAYFLAKWGGESRNPRWNGTPDIEHYSEPFNGKPPLGWTERKRVPSAIAMHWDIINHVAQRIGARRYLEIGVEAGECMKRIRVAEKWGVDPDPTPGGTGAADVFVRKRSGDFFRDIAPHAGTFDLVFIDGDHDSHVVYHEVESAMGLLSPGASSASMT